MPASSTVKTGSEVVAQARWHRTNGAGCGVRVRAAHQLCRPTRSAHTAPGLHVDAEKAPLLFDVAHGPVAAGNQVTRGLDDEVGVSSVSPPGEALIKPRLALREVDGLAESVFPGASQTARWH